ncbi:MAG: hypothetical protein HGA85_03590 [Nanoarchaeota archaeon]|nr:hypothetical protein [Nanoarchaeota archaeon]
MLRNSLKRDSLNGSHFTDAELVIVIGGDGTFLKTTHFNHDTPIFGINPSPKTKEGHLLQVGVDFEKQISAILSGRYTTENRARLEATINGKPISEMALNEFYIGSEKPYMLFNYVLRAKGEAEFQRSSGILIGTPSGTTAWLGSAGGKHMLPYEQAFQVIVREPYVGKLNPACSLRKLVLQKHEQVEILCKGEGILVTDSISEEHILKSEDKVVIQLSKPLPYILPNIK